MSGPKKASNPDPVDRHTICRSRVPPSAPFELHEAHKPGKWVGIAESVAEDVIQGNWMEGYHMSFTALDTGKMQVVVTEGLCDTDVCNEEYRARLRAIYGEEDV